MHILAHRGFWREPAEKNAPEAFDRAFTAGYGVETDVRDLNGELVIAHDPPTGTPQTFAAVLAQYNALDARGWLAINVKADGLAPQVEAAVRAAGVGDRAFVFDMSVPDMLGYLKTDLVVFTRRSEYETAPALLDRAAGVWADAFGPPEPNLDLIAEDLRRGRCVAIVSPELHRRPHESYWAEIKTLLSAEAPDRDRLMLCTDFPDDARSFFGL